MNVAEIIRAKRQGRELAAAEIDLLVRGYARDQVPDYQMSAFLMAVCFQGMTFAETTRLTRAIMSSGRVFDLRRIPGCKVDKHSTGGVGDKVSLVLAPLVAACGVKVPMVSGRGLGHTGGTLDKLESIPGFSTDLSYAGFCSELKRLGFAMMGQTEEFCPADKRMYALRDVTATVDSIPLIAASIMSKKLAEGIDGLVLDVKTGNGAFMSDLKQARQLAETMIAIGREMGKKVKAVITDMSRPLGRSVGNALEVIETLEALKGRGEPDLKEVTLVLGAEMLVMAGKARTGAAGRAALVRAISDGAALRLFRRMIAIQGGDVRVVDDYARMPRARFRLPVPSPGSGRVREMDTRRIGLLGIELEAGRLTTGDRIDPAVGFWFRRKTGDMVCKREVLAEVLANDLRKGRNVARELVNCYRIGRARITPPRLIVERIG